GHRSAVRLQPSRLPRPARRAADLPRRAGVGAAPDRLLRARLVRRGRPSGPHHAARRRADPRATHTAAPPVLTARKSHCLADAPLCIVMLFPHYCWHWQSRARLLPSPAAPRWLSLTAMILFAIVPDVRPVDALQTPSHASKPSPPLGDRHLVFTTLL